MNIAVNKLPGLTPLTRDYLSHYEKVQDFFSSDFRKWDEYTLLAKKVRAISRQHTQDLISLLIEQNKKFNCDARTLKNIEKLGDRNALVVATGQQVGLFTGPLYTVYKALTTIKLAQEIEKRLQSPVLPVFYLVSEDHDFVEVQWAGVVDQSNHFTDIRYQPKEKHDRSPVSQIMLDESINEQIEALAGMLPDTEFKKDIFDNLKTCYQQGAAFHTAFAEWFQKLFSGCGIILFDSADGRFKEFVRPVFKRELEENITIKVLQKTNAELTTRGYHAQLSVHPSRPGLFILKNGRHSLHKQSENYRNLNSGELFSVDELMEHAENLSPKAVLRPIVEDTLFPTIAYVGGPGEIAYWAQLKGVYQAYDLPMPIIFPRAGFTLIEAKVKRHLKKFGLDPTEFITDKKAAVAHISESLIPAGLESKIKTIKDQVQNTLPGLGDEIAEIDPGLKKTFTKTEQSIIHQLNILEHKVSNALRQKESILNDQLLSISANLLPEETLQERKLNIVPYLIKYNWKILEKLYQAIDLNDCNHQLLEL